MNTEQKVTLNVANLRSRLPVFYMKLFPQTHTKKPINLCFFFSFNNRKTRKKYLHWIKFVTFFICK